LGVGLAVPVIGGLAASGAIAGGEATALMVGASALSGGAGSFVGGGLSGGANAGWNNGQCNGSAGDIAQGAWDQGLAALPGGVLGGLLAVPGGEAVEGAAGPFRANTPLTGQIHHPISTRIGRALEEHPTLRGQYQPRDPSFTTQAIDEAAHRGYQTWHIELDAEVARWLQNPDNAAATPAQFEAWLRWRYSQPDLRARFPNGF